MARKRVRLQTVGHVLAELGRVYRLVDRGEVVALDGCARARILREMRVTIEGDALEQRISSLEARNPAEQAGARPNGNGGFHASTRP